MEEKKFKNIYDFVYSELNDDYSGHDHLHALRVYNIAKKIIEEEKIEEDRAYIVLASCLLHDCVDKKLFKNTKKQESKIKKLLKKEKVKKQDIKEILKMINDVSYSKGITPESIEEKILSDADKLDALGAIGIIRTIEYGTSNERKFYSFDQEDDNITISHFYKKILNLKDLMYTNYAKRIAEGRHQFVESFLFEFYKELKE